MRLQSILTSALGLQAHMTIGKPLSIVEASISELQEALNNGQTNAVELLAKHLHRVAKYDRRGPRLNSIPVINQDVFDAALASDDWRASHDGGIRSQLEGIPYTIKDSFMATGMTVASGSPAFENLTAHEDSFTVSRFRQGGAVLMGKTNMPPMANGGMQRGLYGRAESPYNLDYLTAAFASGSSNGCGTSTSSSMAVFGMGEETVSSGRSPASNNGLVAYTPSRNMLSIRGNWPLFPVADVPVPMARTVEDMFALLNVLAVNDDRTFGDFWAGQPFVDLPNVEDVRPADYHSLADPDALRGKRIGVPRMYIGEDDPAAQPVWIRPSVRTLYDNARKVLEGLGAIVEECDFPLVTNSEAKPSSVDWETDYPVPAGAPNASRGPPELWSYGWDDFLHLVNDSDSLTTLADADPALIFPHPEGALPDRYGNVLDNSSSASSYQPMVDGIKDGRIPTYQLPRLGQHLRALEARRKQDLEAWMSSKGYDALAWPAAGDVGRADADTNSTSAIHAWRNGVFFSNGNYAIRKFGVPTVSVTMGKMADIGMPMSLTFAGKAYEDGKLLGYGYAFEQASKARFAAPATPALETDGIAPKRRSRAGGARQAPKLDVEAMKVGNSTVEISGTVDSTGCGGVAAVHVFLDGEEVGPVDVGDDGAWSISAPITNPWEGPTGLVKEVNVPDQTLAMVVVAVASAPNGRSNGKLLYA